MLTFCKNKAVINQEASYFTLLHRLPLLLELRNEDERRKGEYFRTCKDMA
jgi:hypothetical protein